MNIVEQTLRRNIADLELELKRQKERAERAERRERVQRARQRARAEYAGTYSSVQHSVDVFILPVDIE